MATIHPPTLTIAPDEALDRATVRVESNVQFTDFEVNAMNKLGLGYTLQCRVINKDLWYESTVLVLDEVVLPRIAGAAAASEAVVCETVVALDALREHMFTRDELLAEVSLVDTETGAEQVVRSEMLSVDLAAL